MLSGGGVETLIVVEQHKRVGVNPAKREEGEYLRSNKTSTADLQIFVFLNFCSFSFKFKDFSIFFNAVVLKGSHHFKTLPEAQRTQALLL